MILWWTFIIVFCFDLRVIVADSEVEDEITELKTNISSFFSFTAADDILENEYFSKAVNLLSLMSFPSLKVATTLVKSEMDDKYKNAVLKKLDELRKEVIGGIRAVNKNIESEKVELEGFHHYFSFVKNVQVSINIYFEDAMRYISNPWKRKPAFIEICHEFHRDFHEIQRAFELAICKFDGPISATSYATETLDVIDKSFRSPHTKAENQQHESAKQGFLRDISILNPEIVLKIVNTVQSDFIKLRNGKLSSIDDIIMPPYSYRNTCFLKELIQENNYDRKLISNVVRWFLSNLFYLTIINTSCNSVTTDVRYKDKKEKISAMAKHLGTQTNATLDNFFVIDQKHFENYLFQHFRVHSVSETISPGLYDRYSHELKNKLSSLGRSGYQYQVFLFVKKPYISEELKCNDEECKTFAFYDTRVIIRRYGEIITPTTFINQKNWFHNCKYEIENVFQKYPGTHRTLDQFREHLNGTCQPPGPYKYYAFYAVHSSVLSPNPLLSYHGIASLRVLGDHSYVETISTAWLKTYNYKIIMWS